VKFANENGDHVAQKIDNNDIAGLEANGGQEPYMGMKFESHEYAYFFYNHYAKCVGFGMLTKTSHRSKSSRQFIDVKYVCTRYRKK